MPDRRMATIDRAVRWSTPKSASASSAKYFTVRRSRVRRSRPCVGLRADAAQWGEEHTVLLGCRQGSLDEGAELALEGVLRFGDDTSHRAIETSGFPVVQGGEQIVLVGEVLVEQGAGDSRSMGDGTHGDRAWTVLEHQHARDVEQRLATFVAGEPLTSVGNLLGRAHPQSLPRAAVALCHHVLYLAVIDVVAKCHRAVPTDRRPL